MLSDWFIPEVIFGYANSFRNGSFQKKIHLHNTYGMTYSGRFFRKQKCFWNDLLRKLFPDLETASGIGHFESIFVCKKNSLTCRVQRHSPFTLLLPLTIIHDNGSRRWWQDLLRRAST